MLRERRKFRRFPTFLLVLYRLQDQDEWQPGLMLDISPEGMKILTRKPLPTNKTMSLSAELLDGRLSEITSEVVWSEPSSVHGVPQVDRQSFMQGCQFTLLSLQNRRDILSYLGTLGRPEGEREEVGDDELKYLDYRQHYRIPISLSVFCRDSEGNPFSLITEDMSEGGLRFRCKHPLRPGDIVSLQIQLDLTSSPLAVKGKIMWIKGNEEEASGGLKFVNASSETLEKLLEYLQAQAGVQPKRL